MIDSSTGVWASLENWSRTAFVIAGVLWLFAAVVLAVNAATTMSFSPALTRLPRFLGFPFLLIGVFGLYSMLTDQTPQLALAGIGLLVGALVVNIFLLFVVGPQVELPGILGTLLIVSLWFLMGLGGAVLGIASRRTTDLTRAVSLGLYGWFLYGIGLAVTGFVYGGENPAWVSFIIAGVGGLSLVVIGYGLRDSQFTTHAKRSDMTA